MAVMQVTLAELRLQIARLQKGEGAPPACVVPLCDAIDRNLPGNGLVRASVHEVLAADPGAATGFCSLVAARAAGAVVWIGSEPDIWPQGLAAFGLQADCLVLVGARRSKDGLWAFEEALRSPGVAAAVLAVDRHPPDLIAGRRLQLAAEAGGGIGVLLLPDSGLSPPSAARTRWRVDAAPGQRSGDPCWRLSLLRCSGARPAEWTVTWDRIAGKLKPAFPQASAMSAGGRR
jgi:protein ImuA